MAIANTSNQPQSRLQDTEVLNCPSLGGLSVETDATLENNRQSRNSEEEDSYFAQSDPKQEQTHRLDTWNPLGFEDSLLQNRPEASYSSALVSDPILCTNMSQLDEPWDNQQSCRFPHGEVSSSGGPLDNALKHTTTNELYNLDIACHPYGEDEGQHAFSGMPQSVCGSTASTNQQRHSIHASNGDLTDCMPLLETESAQVGGDPQWWQTSNADLTAATTASAEVPLTELTEGMATTADWGSPFSQSAQIGGESRLGEDLLLENGSGYLHSQTIPLVKNSSGEYDQCVDIQDGYIWDEETSTGPQGAGPFLMNPQTLQYGSLVIPRWSSKDDYLVQQKQAGLTYKEIKLKGHFAEAESTLRGRYRNLTKRKEERVRRPEWEDRDIILLKQAVQLLGPSDLPKTPGSGSRARQRPKIPWKKISEYIANHGGSYKFGNATCRKKWDELQEED
ncbi:MAG: hypothetical protein Q9157_005028 [Trypethelium eluteriae]